MIRIHLRHGDRHVEITDDDASTNPTDLAAVARNLWAIVVAAGPTADHDDPPKVEAGGFGFAAGELSPHIPDHTRPPLHDASPTTPDEGRTR